MLMTKPITKNLIDGIDIEFCYNDIFNDMRPKRIIVYKNQHQNYPDPEVIIKNTIKKFGFSISYGEFDNKDVLYEAKIITCLTSKNKL